MFWFLDVATNCEEVNSGNHVPSIGGLEHFARRGGKCRIPRKILGDIEQASKQLYLVEEVPVYCKGVGLEHL